MSTAPTVDELLREPPNLFIDNTFVGSVDRFDVENPATGETLASVASASAADVDAAVTAARRAFPTWAAMAPTQRARLLWRLADLIELHGQELATIDSLDNGKPIAEALAVDVPLTTEIFRYYAGWVTKLEGRVVPVSIPNFHTYTRREPLGVVGAIIPWNFPLLMCAYKLGPALAAGNTVVLKPAEQTPLSALRLAALVREAGIPPGVVNVVTGFGEPAGAALAAHPDVDKITFTGETTTGQKILDASKGNLKRVTLELGGKSPNIVFDDADIDAAIEGAFGGIFFNQGQCCVAGSRLFVQDGIYDELVSALTARADRIRLGSGLDPDTDMGPLVSNEQLERVLGYVDQGRDEGATLLTGGTRDGAVGHFVRPAVFADVDPEMAIMRDEIFGPVVAASRFTSEEEVIAIANGTHFGLAAGVWTRDLSRAHRTAAAIQSGTVWINTYGMFDVAAPYGGYKMSGYGRELGAEALDSYLQTKTIWTSLG